ncbi:MAG: hypothetical protein LQ337_001838 [Flavoplaca oasis]|nr:MAG: hypothetical protein LQ337_001838 [Flavoplaca oasis]
MSEARLAAAILVVSDTASRDPSTDKAGPILADVFNQYGSNQWAVSEIQIVSDDVVAIQRQVVQWCDGEASPNLIVTTGGTGFTLKDNTPEAINPLLHKHATGLIHGMLAASLEITPFAVMSRPVAGVRNKSIIITLPGSPKGAKENLLSVLKQLPHACKQAAGEDSRVAHAGGLKTLEGQAGIGPDKMAQPLQHHSCGHDDGAHTASKAYTSNDPTEGAAQRHRESPYPKISVEDALQLILEHTPTPQYIQAPVNSSLVGCVLAEDVQAEEPVPAFRASIMDGYAVVVTQDNRNSKGTFPVTSVSHASPGETSALQTGQIARITTGAPLPAGATSVVPIEVTEIAKKIVTDNGQEEEREVVIKKDTIMPGENVREVGSDIKAGETILRKGELVTAVGGELGLLASVGRREVLVYKKPTVGVLSTGDEIVPHDRPSSLRTGEVRDTNRPTVMAAVRGWGFEVVDLGIAKDKQDTLEQSLRDTMRKVDVIITTGGVSMGELDLLKPTIERSLGGSIHFGRISMKPGMPTTFATVPFKNTAGDMEDRLFFSLPGNPASAIVTSHLFVLPSLQRSSGVHPIGLPKIQVILDQDVRPDPTRPEYHRVVVTAGNDGLLHATSTGGQRSSRVGSLKGANALLCLPATGGMIATGERIQALMMGSLLSQ